MNSQTAALRIVKTKKNAATAVMTNVGLNTDLKVIELKVTRSLFGRLLYLSTAC